MTRWGVRWRRSSRARRIAVVLPIIVAILLTPVAAAAVFLRLQDAGTLRGDARTRGHDAVWLGHAWVDGRKSDADIAQLGILLAGTGIKDLYVHTGPLDNDGTLSPRLYPQARWFLGAVHRTLPGIRVQAWLGDVLTPEFDGLNTDDPGTREHVVTTSSQVLDLGFDGIHFDFEPVRSGSNGYVTILDRVRAVTSARHALRRDRIDHGGSAPDATFTARAIRVTAIRNCCRSPLRLSIRYPDCIRSAWPCSITGNGGRKPISRRWPGAWIKSP
ncbi:hypothetical protein [Nocardia sp. NPDC051981]|uniref:hypothetical protein n=1 Tax=Nocardia sp. NPDC051981 TaxID=3155417 RepID=UPI003431BFA3